jgi:glycosyltransferase involved in cell wall biosynthesis
LRKQYNVDVSVVIAGRLTFPSVLAELLLLAKHLSIENRVRFIPNITEEDLIAAYKGCKVFCLPSINEALPLVLLEAMANTKPIVASSVGGITSVVEDGVTGFLVPPRDPIKLAEALSKLCLDNQLYSKMSQAAKRRVEMFTWDNVVRRILKLYDRLIEEVS